MFKVTSENIFPSLYPPSGDMVKDKTIMTPSSLFVIILAGFYLVTALMHPQEVGLVVHGFLYILCIPSAYLLLSIYSMVNMNNVSWGTRETAPAPAPDPGAAAPAAAGAQTNVDSSEPQPEPQNTIVADESRSENEER